MGRKVAAKDVQTKLHDVLLGDFQWKTDDPVILPDTSGDNPCYAIKDPSVLFFEGRWHVFSSILIRNAPIQMEYMSFSDWNEASVAPRHRLELVKDDYHCAPQVFYFRPHQKWYLIYQARDMKKGMPFRPCFSTNRRLNDPRGWTSAEPLYDRKPSILDGTFLEGWIDFWVICDESRAWLFFTSNDGRMWRAETALGRFPLGWSEPQVVLKADIWEACHVYRLRDTDCFLNIIEAIDKGRRYFQAYTAPSLGGDWTPLAGGPEKPFAHPLNVSFLREPWADFISHGEFLRTCVDERMELALNADEFTFLYQGVADAEAEGKEYRDIPWKLGLLKPEIPRFDS